MSVLRSFSHVECCQQGRALHLLEQDFKGTNFGELPEAQRGLVRGGIAKAAMRVNPKGGGAKRPRAAWAGEAAQEASRWGARVGAPAGEELGAPAGEELSSGFSSSSDDDPSPPRSLASYKADTSNPYVGAARRGTGAGKRGGGQARGLEGGVPPPVNPSHAAPRARDQPR